ncbi:hypothetical protein FACS1894132_11780 [Clostridia bacterium]|nr:hypothetical protein FACS1894132_11780 [Clostridia bacterium]
MSLYFLKKEVKMKIKRKNLVEKRNVLNEMRTYDMNCTELRIFYTYLAKINPLDQNSCIVTFPVSFFKELLGTETITISHLKIMATKLLQRIVKIVTERNGRTGLDMFQLFKRCRIEQDIITGEWYFELEAHEDALPLMFDFKGKYFKYELENIMGLTSANQIRIYEILKQYENIGERVLTISELKDLIGISTNEYPQYMYFKRDVLEISRKAIEEHTDIKFTYEPAGRKGRGGKIFSLRFIISHNEKNDIKKNVKLKNTSINELKSSMPFNFQNNYYDDDIAHIANVCQNSFDNDEMKVIKSLLENIVSVSLHEDMNVIYAVELKPIYAEFQRKMKNENIKFPFKYFCGMLKKMGEKAEAERNKKLNKCLRELENEI